MKRLPYKRPTDHYDESIKGIDEKICKLIQTRKILSDNNPGYPPLEYISRWADDFGLYEEMLKSMFGVLWYEKQFKPYVEPEGFRLNVPVLKWTDINNCIYSVNLIRQYNNCSIVNFCMDWDSEDDSPDERTRHRHFELELGGEYDCRLLRGSGSEGHYCYHYVVSPALPDEVSGMELLFKEYNQPFDDSETGMKVVFRT